MKKCLGSIHQQQFNQAANVGVQWESVTSHTQTERNVPAILMPSYHTSNWTRILQYIGL